MIGGTIHSHQNNRCSLTLNYTDILPIQNIGIGKCIGIGSTLIYPVATVPSLCVKRDEGAWLSTGLISVSDNSDAPTDDSRFFVHIIAAAEWDSSWCCQYAGSSTEVLSLWRSFWSKILPSSAQAQSQLGAEIALLSSNTPTPHLPPRHEFLFSV